MSRTKTHVPLFVRQSRYHNSHNLSRSRRSGSTPRAFPSTRIVCIAMIPTPHNDSAYPDPGVQPSATEAIEILSVTRLSYDVPETYQLATAFPEIKQATTSIDPGKRGCIAQTPGSADERRRARSAAAIRKRAGRRRALACSARMFASHTCRNIPPRPRTACARGVTGVVVIPNKRARRFLARVSDTRSSQNHSTAATQYVFGICDPDWVYTHVPGSVSRSPTVQPPSRAGRSV